MPLRLEWPGSRLYKFIHSRRSLVLTDMISTFSSRGRGEASRGESLDLILGTGLSIAALRPRGPPERFTFATRNFPRDRCDPIILLIRGRSTEPHSLRNAPRRSSQSTIFKCVSWFSWRVINNADIWYTQYTVPPDVLISFSRQIAKWHGLPCMKFSKCALDVYFFS